MSNLIVSRKRGEKIVIGEDVIVTVLEIKGQQIKLGIDAPEHVKIMRSELIEDNEPSGPR